MSQCSIELFREACGLNGPLCVSLDEGERTASRIFEQPFFVAGRKQGMDLVLEHEAVSRRHVYFQVIAGRLFCVDLGSRTGVHWVRGLEPSGWVDDRQGVLVGPFRILAGEDPGPTHRENPLTARPLDDPILPQVILEFPTTSRRPPWRVSRVLTLMGRAPGCRLRCEDPSVSKFHCSLLRTPTGVWVVNLFGRGGIEVNGQRVRWARLEYGDRFQVGPYLVRLREAGASSDKSISDASTALSLIVAPPDSGWPAALLEGGVGPTPSPRVPPPARLILPEVVAEHREDPAALKAELVEPLMAQLASQCGQMQQQMFEQFGQMQQQMFEQFQQAMMMMAQVFGNLHRDQLAMIREEVDRLRQLNQDLHALQAQVKLGSPPPDTRSTAALTNSDATANALARIESMLLASLSHSETLLAGGDPTGASSEPRPERASPSILTTRQEHGTLVNGATPEEGRSPGGTTGPPSAPPMGFRSAPDLETLPKSEIHACLHMRIAALQKERQSRLHRILGLVLGQ